MTIGYIKSTRVFTLITLLLISIITTGISHAGENSLLYAVKKGDLDGVRDAVANGVDIPRDILSFTLKKKKCEIATFFLEKGVAIPDSALSEAAESGCTEVVKYLIDRGADVNRVYKDNRREFTPLLISVINSNVDIVKLILDHGADIKIEGNPDYYNTNDIGTALIFAIKNNQPNIVKILLENGADVRVRMKSKKFANRNKSVLFLAIKTRNIDIISMLLKYNIDINEEINNEPIVLFALEEKQPEIARLLIDNGACTHISDKDKSKLLITSLEGGYLDIAKILIQNGADVNTIEHNYGRTALILVASSVRAKDPMGYEVVQLLTERGAEINVTDKEGYTALHYARNPRVVNWLLAHDAKATADEFLKKIGQLDVDTTKLFLEKYDYADIADQEGNTPLMRVASHNCSFHRNWLDIGGNPNKGIKLAKILLEYGANPNRQNSRGDTAIKQAADCFKPGVVKLLWEHGADLDIKNNQGKTINEYRYYKEVERILDWIQRRKKTPLENLFVGIEYYDIELIEEAVESGADANGKEQNKLSRFVGFTPFQIAVSYGYSDIVRFLIEQGGADVNSQSSQGSVLVFAVRQGHQEIVKYLIEKGANVQPQFGTSPISIAEKKENNEMIALLQAAGAQSSRTLWKAVIENDYKTVKDELEKGVNANDPILLDDYNGWSPLAVAAKLNFVDIAELLIQHKADVNTRAAEPPFYKWGGTILHSAVAEGNEDIVKLLSENGANVEAKFVTGQFKGFTPLKIAEEENNLNLIRILKKSGAKTSSQKEEMKKALFQAVLSGDLDKVKSLIDDGVDVNTQIDKNNQGGLKTVIWENEEQYSENLTWLLKNYKLSGTTALVVAISQGYGEIASLLLDKGAEPNTKIRANNSKYFITPLLLATYLGNAEIVQMLLEHGADNYAKVWSRDLGGKTALSIAVKKKNVDIVQLLLQAGIVQKSAGIQKSEAPAEELQSVDQMLEHGEKVVPELIKILKTRDSSPSSTESMKEWRHTVDVMEMLAEWKAEQAVGVLREMVTSSDDLSAIYNAARTVGKIGGNTSFTALTNVLAESDNPQDENAIHRKRAAILGLGLCGNIQAVPLLIQEMQNQKNDDLIRVCAAGSLGLLGDQSGLQVALEGTDSTDPQLRLRSIEMLGAIGDPSAFKQLEKIIKSQAPYVYKLAAKTSMMMIETQQLSDQEQIKYLSENLVKFHRMTAFVRWGTSRLKALNTEESRKALQSLTEAGSSFVRDTARLKLQTMR